MLEGVVMLAKICTKCGIDKTIDMFYKGRRGKHGVRSVCILCEQEYRESNKEAIAQQRREYTKANKERIVEYKNINKEVIAARKKAYYQANKAVINASRKDYMREYRQANKESIASYQKEYRKPYREANRELFTAYSAERKALKLKATPAWADTVAILGVYHLAKVFNSTGINLHVDHIVPLQSDVVCGLHCEANLQLLPSSDNISKGNRWWPDMW
jgi:hypothetical protein